MPTNAKTRVKQTPPEDRPCASSSTAKKAEVYPFYQVELVFRPLCCNEVPNEEARIPDDCGHSGPRTHPGQHGRHGAASLHRSFPSPTNCQHRERQSHLRCSRSSASCRIALSRKRKRCPGVPRRRPVRASEQRRSQRGGRRRPGNTQLSPPSLGASGQKLACSQNRVGPPQP